MSRRDLVFRVFVSSTFSDLVEERNQLQKTTFPELRRYCRERGARFQAIDLRWGVSREASLNQRTMNICLEELRRCQSLSPRPNFIVLLGNRYGWRPLPAEIEAVEFEKILAKIPEAEKSLVTTDSPVNAWRDGQHPKRTGWYRKDCNAQPELYILQPRTIDFPENATEEDKKRIRQDEANNWQTMEKRIRQLFTDAIKELSWMANDPRLFKYEASATHQEIQAGAMQAEDPGSHVFCYFREIDEMPSDQTASIYRDITGNTVDTDSQNRLKSLKKELQELLPSNHLHRLQASWQNNQPHYEISGLCEKVENDLKSIIDQEIESFEQKSGLERELDANREFAEERCLHFTGRQEIITKIHSYVNSNDSHPLIIHGSSGSGKTALMAKVVSELSGNNSETGPIIVSRFIGATPGSSDLRTLLGDICRELGIPRVPQDMNKLVETFRTLLSPTEKGNGNRKNVTASGRQIVIFLDALDQLNKADNAWMLHWLPRKLKPGVKLIFSVLENTHPFETASRIWPESLIKIGPLDRESGKSLLNAWLSDDARKLNNEQEAEIFRNFAKCPFPLYLKLVSEQARIWRSWENVSGKLPDSMEGLLVQLLERLEQPGNHGRLLVCRALSYLAAAKNGLTEDELIDVLSRKESGILQDFSQRSPESPAVDHLPVIIWSRLFSEIKRYMTMRRADGTIVMDFYHRQVGEAVLRRYLYSKDALIQTHLHLADYFGSLDFWAESLEAQQARAKRLPPTPRPANIRKVVELPYHRLEAAKLGGKDDPASPLWDAVADLLTDWQFLEAKTEANPNYQPEETPVEQS